VEITHHAGDARRRQRGEYQDQLVDGWAGNQPAATFSL
jgi:hypothetical protein